MCARDAARGPLLTSAAADVVLSATPTAVHARALEPSNKGLIVAQYKKSIVIATCAPISAAMMLICGEGVSHTLVIACAGIVPII